MSRILRIDEICERALRKIGAYAIRSSGPRPEEMDEARFWLNMVIGHVSAKMRTWWLVPGTGTFALTANTAVYSLQDVLTSSQAPDGIQFVIAAYLFNPATNQDVCELRLLRRQEYERIDDKACIGEPECIYVDRAQAPTATIYPVSDGTVPYVVRVLFQSYSADFVKNRGVDRTYKVRSAWNLWMVVELARQLGNGPVRKQPADEVAEMKQEAAELLRDLESYEAFEQAGEPRRTRYFNGI